MITAEELIQNTGLLIRFAYGNLPEDLDRRVVQIIEKDDSIGEIVDSIVYLALALKLDEDQLRTKLLALEEKIVLSTKYLKDPPLH